MSAKSGKMERVVVLTAGGTFDKVYFDALSDYQIGEPQAAEILDMGCVDEGDYVLESVLRKDSLDMGADDRALLRACIEARSERRFLVVHGTDTMTDTAASLTGLAGHTIVLTGAMRPARFKDSDAPFNTGFAYAAARTLTAGVYIAMHGRVFPADAVRKNRKAGRFESLD